MIRWAIIDRFTHAVFELWVNRELALARRKALPKPKGYAVKRFKIFNQMRMW
jgi:hypothetical protein